MYRITFNLEQKTHTIRAKSVVYDYPMVVVQEIVWSTGSPLILAPEDQTRKRFEDANQIIVPFHNIQLIEEISERRPQIREIGAEPKPKPAVRELLLRDLPKSEPNKPKDKPEN